MSLRSEAEHAQSWTLPSACDLATPAAIGLIGSEFIWKARIMAGRKPPSYRKRTAVIASIAISCWLIVMLMPSLAEARADVMLFGLPLRVALALPVGLPLLVLTMFWFAARQNRDDERFRNDD
jgi:hypothetical protein